MRVIELRIRSVADLHRYPRSKREMILSASTNGDIVAVIGNPEPPPPLRDLGLSRRIGASQVDKSRVAQ